MSRLCLRGMCPWALSRCLPCARVRASQWARVSACALLGLLAPFAFAQQKPLERSFSAGDSAGYRIKLTVRSEVAGQQTELIGAKAYVRPFSRAAENGLGWRATRHVLSVDAYGTAEIEETLDGFEDFAEGAPSADEETEKLAKALREALAGWGAKHTLRYRETRAGQLLDLKAEGVPPLGEAPPALLTLWLLRALRPTAALPSSPLRFGESSHEPRSVQLPNWAEVRAAESGEWLDAREASEPAARLHIVQILSGTVVTGAEKPPEGTAEGHFHGESLNTISLGDARLLAATRSATREIAWTLAAVEGLPERPRFVGRLSVQIEMEACNEDPCLSLGPAARRSRQ